MKKNIFLLFLSLLIITGCREVTTNVDGDIPDGAYSYEAYNSSGNLIVFGWFTMDIKDNQISGEWNFKETSTGAAIGPHIGKGKLQGSKDNNQISINLNPNWVDNNIFLNCSMDGNNLSGTWNYSGYAGNLASGKFYAVKIN